MALVVGLKITRKREGRLHLDGIDEVVIQRMEPLANPQDPAEEVHTYQATLSSTAQEVTFTHRYGDGALRCLELALEKIRLDDTLSI